MRSIVRLALLVLLATLVPAALMAQTPAPPTAQVAGTWRCQVDYNGTAVDVGVHLGNAADGALTATLDNVTDPGGPAMEASATLHDGQLHLDVPSLSTSFDGKLNAAGNSIEGGWAMDGGNLACTLAKDAPAQP